MATALVAIRDGKIVWHQDRYFESVSEDGKVYVGNGWTVKIEDGDNGRPGRIICHAEREYAKGPAICHREFKLADGRLGLAGGNINERYAYFRSAKFQSFLSEHGITAVKKENPNQEYNLRNAHYGGGRCEMSIRTDGQMTEIAFDGGRTSEWQSQPGYTCAYEGWATVKVTGATYVIVDKVQHEHDSHNGSSILYSVAKDVTKLTILD